jgi:hypothetical protein
MWWYARDDQHQGPFSETDFKELAASGRLRPTDLVWKNGFTDWAPAAAVPDLLPPQADPPPLPPQRPRAAPGLGSENPPFSGSFSLPVSGELTVSMPTLFRSVMIGSLALSLLSAIFGEALAQTLPAPLQNYLIAVATAEPSGGIVLLGVISLAVVVLTIIALIGLWKFRPWARTLYVALTICSFPLVVAAGPAVMNPWQNLFVLLSMMLGGILLAMLFLPPIAAEFRKT